MIPKVDKYVYQTYYVVVAMKEQKMKHVVADQNYRYTHRY